MNEKEIRRILLAEVSDVRCATDEETKTFADKPDGVLYVLGGKTGHKFLAHIAKEKEEYTFRPMGDFLPNLKEFGWKECSRRNCAGVETFIHCTDAVSQAEYDAYSGALVPYLDPAHATDVTWMYHFKYNPLYKRVFNIRRIQAERFVVAKKTPEPGKVVFQRGRGRE